MIVHALKNTPLPLVAFALCLLMHSHANASLEWDDRSKSIEATFSDTNAQATYSFTNTGKTPVTITSVSTSCGCTDAEASEETIAPGESGHITVNFEFGDRVGQQNKRIVVRTNDADSPTTTLTFEVTIPQAVKFRPGLAYWRNHEERTPKEIELELLSPAETTKIVDVRMSEQAFEVELSKTETDGKPQYTLTITPPPTQSQTKQATIEVEVEIEPGVRKVYRAYAKML